MTRRRHRRQFVDPPAVRRGVAARVGATEDPIGLAELEGRIKGIRSLRARLRTEIAAMRVELEELPLRCSERSEAVQEIAALVRVLAGATEFLAELLVLVEQVRSLEPAVPRMPRHYAPRMAMSYLELPVARTRAAAAGR